MIVFLQIIKYDELKKNAGGIVLSAIIKIFVNDLQVSIRHIQKMWIKSVNNNYNN